MLTHRGLIYLPSKDNTFDFRVEEHGTHVAELL